MGLINIVIMKYFIHNIKHLLLTVLLSGVAFSGYSQCITSGSITVSASGFQNGVGHTQAYVLVDDASDEILVINSTGTFTGLTAQPYRIYAINYDGATPAELLVGDDWADLVVNTGTYCLNIIGPYDCTEILCLGDDLVATASGFTASGNFEERYAVVNSSGNIISTNTTGTFSGLAVGEYTVYAVNTDDAALKSEIDNLGAWSDIPASSACSQILGPRTVICEVCTYPTPLPISLLEFNGKLNNGKVDLDWITSTEINNDYFTIERSQDGSDFTPILNIKGAGNSSNILNYSDVDYNPLQGVSYYRLKQTDFDGESSYSKTIVINNTPQIFKIYPNPNNGEFINIEGLSGTEKVNLTDAQGKLIKRFNAEGNSSLRINLSEYDNGMYFFVITTNQDVITEKIIKY